jgi:hypothetical protein
MSQGGRTNFVQYAAEQIRIVFIVEERIRYLFTIAREGLARIIIHNGCLRIFIDIGQAIIASGRMGAVL